MFAISNNIICISALYNMLKSLLLENFVISQAA